MSAVSCRRLRAAHPTALCLFWLASAACGGGAQGSPAAPAGASGAAVGGRGQAGGSGRAGESGTRAGAGATAGDASAAGTAAAGRSAGGASGRAGGAGQSGRAGASGSAAMSGELVNPAPGSKLFFGANFWNIDWEGSSNYFANGVDWATTQNPWNPQLLTDLEPYHVLRFMDWNLTNEENNPQASWDTRKKPTEAQTGLVAFEWQIDLCNRAQKDYWVNIPHAASADYIMKLATLIHERLDARLRVYVEWSNEVWNGGFPQRAYAQSQGQKLGLAGSDKAASYLVYQSVRAFETFEAVFGAGPRVVKVLAGQAAYTGPCMAHVAALKDKTINPKGTQPSVYAVAPYFRGGSLEELLNDGIPEATNWVRDSYTCAKAAGWPLIAYEGGQDSYQAAGGESGCAQIQRMAGMREAYVKFLDGMLDAQLSGPFMHYTHSGRCWGLKQKTSDSAADSPKYQGVLDWLEAHP